MNPNNRIFTGKCAISQTGSGTGYWIVSITNFNDPGGQFDATEINAGDYLYFSDSGNPYSLEIILVVSASGSNATVRVDNVGVTEIGSVPTTPTAFVSRRSVNYGLSPWVANLSGNDNQLHQEYTTFLIDELFAAASGGGGGITDLGITGTSSPLTLTSSTGTDVTIIAGTNVTLAGTANTLTINAVGDGQGVTAVTASAPLASTGGNTPNISLSGIVPVGNGGTGSATQNWWDLATDQTSLGTKRTTGGLLVGSIAPFTGHRFGTTSQHIVAYKGGSAALSAESLWQDFNGEVHEINSQVTSGTTNEHRVVATGDDSANKGSKFTEYARAAGASKNVVKTTERGVYAADLPYLTIGSAGSSTMFANSTYNSALNVPGTGVAIEGTVGYLFTSNGGAGGEDFRIVQKSGATYTTTASINATFNGWNVGSDKKLKHDIETVNVTPELIRKLNTRKFKWNHSDAEDLGVIAQDFLEDDILKLILRGNEEEGLQVNPLGIAALALGAVKTLQKQIDELKEEIELLKNK
jgi:hypothetical protein